MEAAAGANEEDSSRFRTGMDVSFPIGSEADATGPTSSMFLEIVPTIDVVPSRAVPVGD